MLRSSSAIFLLLTACSGQVSDPGLCSLDCSKALIGPIEADIVPLSTSSGITCSAAAAGTVASDPLIFYFSVSETSQFGSVEKIIPNPNVSLEPIVNGLTSNEAIHNPNVTIDNGIYTPARYKGIITPKADWCTDACGVATFEVFAVCPPAGETTQLDVQVHTGANFSDKISVTLQTQDAP